MLNKTKIQFKILTQKLFYINDSKISLLSVTFFEVNNVHSVHSISFQNKINLDIFEKYTNTFKGLFYFLLLIF